jgi:hypothetical protein
MQERVGAARSHTLPHRSYMARQTRNHIPSRVE